MSHVNVKTMVQCSEVNNGAVLLISLASLPIQLKAIPRNFQKGPHLRELRFFGENVQVGVGKGVAVNVARVALENRGVLVFHQV